MAEDYSSYGKAAELRRLVDELAEAGERADAALAQARAAVDEVERVRRVLAAKAEEARRRS